MQKKGRNTSLKKQKRNLTLVRPPVVVVHWQIAVGVNWFLGSQTSDRAKLSEVLPLINLKEHEKVLLKS